MMNEYKEAILDQIEHIRRFDNFDNKTMRWQNLFLQQNKRLTYCHTRKERNATPNIIHLSEASRDDFASLSPKHLVDALVIILRQYSRQM